MNKSKPKSSEETSLLAAAISEAKSLPLFSAGGVSASPPSSEPPPSPMPTETQRIGSLVIPKWAWTALWPHNANTVRMRLGGELLEITSKGQWEPPMPTLPEKRELPTPRPDESHQSYFLRVLALFKGQAHPTEHSLWLATRKWVGEVSDALRDKIAEGNDLPGYTWTFANEKPL